MNEMSVSQIESLFKNDFSGVLYVYTPICGTCQMASKMLAVVEELLPTKTICKIDLNYFPQLAVQLEIESVPCLLVFESGTIRDKIYAFKSVTDLFERMS